MTTITLNGREVSAQDGETILDVAKRSGVDIPRLCHHNRLKHYGGCRLCVVEVSGQQRLAASCCTPVREGMVIKTHSAKVLDARRTNLELLLANHDLNCATCVANRSCMLQKYADDLMMTEIPFTGSKREEPVDDSSVSIRRDNNKCILCGRCIRMCNDTQTVYAIGQNKRGFHTRVSPAFDGCMKDSSCVNCGQCVIVCPTGALSETSDVHNVINALNSGKYLIAQTAPSVRATLGECFGMPPGTPVTGKMVAALKHVGFNQVFDTNFAADITIMEEATEFVKRFTEQKNLPLITTCCPAWIKFTEQFFFDQIHHMSSCRSPQAILASLIRNYFSEKLGVQKEDIILVDIMPCTAKKFEIAREEYKGDADYVLTTVELGKLLKQFNVDFASLPDLAFDNPAGESSGAADIFGRTGGVMEAALRTAADMVSGEDLHEVDYTAVRGMETMKEAEITIADKKVRVCAVHTLGEARKIMEMIRAGNCPYHFIEVMACYGGCVGGGGQPRPETREIKNLLVARTSALTHVDEIKVIRKSHKNEAVQKLYKEYLGEPGSKRAHELLHTSYVKREYL